MRKIGNDIGEVRHSRKLDQAAFIPPKGSGMAQSDDQKNENRNGQESRGDNLNPFNGRQTHTDSLQAPEQQSSL